MKSDFFALLEEQDLSENSHWKKSKGAFHKDPRYKAADSSSQREVWFNEYIKSLGKTKASINISVG